jgi:IclR family transcriptional regulator, acetate operon repressor
MSSVKEIQSVRNACALLEAVAARQPIGVSDVARATGIDKSAAQRLAVTLHAAGWLDRTGDGRWRVAPDLIHLARQAAEGSMVAAMRPLLERLRDETGETAILVTIEHDRLRVVDMVESRQALRISPSGRYLPLRRSSAARAIAAHLPPDELTALREIDPSLDEDTLIDVRRHGWAINDREIVDDARVVGVAVRRTDGPPLGAVIIAAPTSRMSLEDMQRVGARLAATVTARAPQPTPAAPV